ncbi:MAG TPA: DUF4012 domain-containing protein [Acidimicrobiales bacterium]|nr:DUF4012 domain-containing protein [Acidimicrobiales bacterium]
MASRGRRVRAGAILIAAAVVAGALVLAWAAWDLHQIRRDLAVGGGRLSSLSLEGEGIGASAASAAVRLDRADRRARTSVALGLLGHLPGADHQVAEVRALTAATARLGEAAHRASARVDAALAEAGRPGGRVRLVDVVEQEAATLQAAVARTDLGPGGGLVGPLGDARRNLDRALDAGADHLAAARRVLDPLRQLLAGPHTYLLLAANNAEMAGGAGLALSAGRLTFEDGQLHLGAMVPAGDLRSGQRVDAPLALRQVYESTGVGLDLRSTTRSPDLTATGPVAVELAEANGWGPIDGVIVVDAVALRDLLEVTGPVTVDGFRVDARNVLDEVLHQAYRRADVTGDQDLRTDHQSEIARAVVEALEQRAPSPSALLAALVDSRRARHLLAWSADPDLQAAWDALGVSGRLPEDGLLISFQNHGADKLDWYLRPTARLDVTPTDDGAFRARLTMTMDVPSRQEIPDASPYILGPTPDDHGVLLTVHLPAAAHDIATTDPEGFHRAGIDGGLPVRTFLAEVPAGARFERTIEFTLPASTTSLALVPSARVAPLPITIDGVVTVDDGMPRRITWLAALRALHPADPGPLARAGVAAGLVAVGASLPLLGRAGLAAVCPRRRRAGVRPR